MRGRPIPRIIVLILIFGAQLLVAQTVQLGQFRGQLLDDEGYGPVVGANVAIVGTKLGAVSDFDGNFLIPRLKPGKYVLQISSLEYTTVRIENVQVLSDLATIIEKRLEKKIFELDKVLTRCGSRNIISRICDLNTVAISAEDIANRPVKKVDELLKIVSRLSCCNGSTGNIDDDVDDIVDISDIVFFVDHLFTKTSPLPCSEEGNIDGDPNGSVNMADLRLLIDHLFISFSPTALCDEQD